MATSLQQKTLNPETEEVPMSKRILYRWWFRVRLAPSLSRQHSRFQKHFNLLLNLIIELLAFAIILQRAFFCNWVEGRISGKEKFFNQDSFIVKFWSSNLLFLDLFLEFGWVAGRKSQCFVIKSSLSLKSGLCDFFIKKLLFFFYQGSVNVKI